MQVRSTSFSFSAILLAFPDGLKLPILLGVLLGHTSALLQGAQSSAHSLFGVCANIGSLRITQLWEGGSLCLSWSGLLSSAFCRYLDNVVNKQSVSPPIPHLHALLTSGDDPPAEVDIFELLKVSYEVSIQWGQFGQATPSGLWVGVATGRWRPSALQLARSHQVTSACRNSAA